MEGETVERSAELLLSDLTPGGSEFTTPQRCFEWARDALASAQQQAIRAHAEKNRLRAEVARLSADRERALTALKNLYDHIEERDFKTDGGGYYLYVLDGVGYPDHRHKNGTERLMREAKAVLADLRGEGR